MVKYLRYFIVKNIKYIKDVVLIMFLALAVVAVLHFFDNSSPEKQIAMRLEKFLTDASKVSGDKLSTGLIKSKSLEKFFMPNCRFHIGVSAFSGTYSPEQISSNSMRCRTMFKYVKFSAHDVQIKLNSPTTATVDFTGALNGVTKSSKAINDYRELTCELQLAEGEWLISSVSVREIIKK
ncbi:MAG: hypothetical protein PHV82_02315 [Victivallaceae bacterium]|nr:hypothetical protein [Victivallaceae bacterium]